MSAQQCPTCGSNAIVAGVHVGKTAETGDIGLSHKPGFLLTATEPLIADLCTSCGTVVRLRVRNPDRRWTVVKD